MIDIHGRFAIRERFDEKDYRVSILFWKDGKSYQFGINIPQESLAPIVEDEIQISGLGQMPEKIEGQPFDPSK